MEPEYIEIATKQGKLKGLLKNSQGLAKKKYYSFQGIPYAKPPIGKLRFKAPEPFGKWEGIQDATKEGNDCVQLHMIFKNPTGDEDCLYLNVYSTQLEESTKKAVMVWIHGGGFQCGSGSSELYGPDYFIEEDVVLVTINYRCGALGFLSLENETLPGNNGLKDQALALQWVQQNISAFGGDPGNVTIFGESAGSASVNYHLLSPLSQGLFHKAILQSGVSFCQWACQQRPREKAFLFAKELGCTSQDPEEVLEFFMSIPATELIKPQYTAAFVSNKEKLHKFALQFLPCVEKVGDAPFLTDNPCKMMERGEFTKVPLIIGVTDKEGWLALAVKEIHIEMINGDLSLMVPLDIKTKPGSEEKLGRDILKFYTNQDILSWDDIHGYLDFVGDIEFYVGFEKSRQCFLRHCESNTPIYTYLFTYTSPRALSSFTVQSSYPDKALEFIGTGASHGDELIHQFKPNSPQMPFVPPNEKDQLFMDKFLKVWTNFAKTGNPNSTDLGVTWKPDDIQNPHYMELGNVWKTIDDIYFPKRMAFWKSLYDKYSFSYE